MRNDIVMLAPVSVHADYFHKHVGVTMLTQGIQKVKELGFKGIIVEGSFNFYNRVGFKTEHFLSAQLKSSDYFSNFL